MTIENVPQEQWAQLEPFLAQHGTGLPDPDSAHVLVARDDEGTLTGFIVVQLQLHVEPLYVAPEYRYQGLALQLWRAALQCIPAKVPYFVFTSHERIEKLAQTAGLVQLPWHVYQGVH